MLTICKCHDCIAYSSPCPSDDYLHLYPHSAKQIASKMEKDNFKSFTETKYLQNDDYADSRNGSMFEL